MPCRLLEDDMPKVPTLAWLALAYPFLTVAETKPATDTSVRTIVTLGHRYGPAPITLTRNDLAVTQNYDPLPVTNLVPLRGELAGLELFVLVDNCSSCEAGTQFEELSRFIVSQPSTTAVGIAYIDVGRLQVAVNPTFDRQRAIQGLSTPSGNKPSDPFRPLVALIKGWQENASRHVVLMISTGLDPAAAAKDAPTDPSAEAAIEAAQRAGVAVYAIYHPSADFRTTDYSKLHYGQVQLAHVAVETGGEAYFTDFGPLPSLAPFLVDLADHLANQYLLEFRTRSAPPPGALQHITIKSTLPDVELMAPYRVWVPGAMPAHKGDGHEGHPQTRL